MTFQRTLQRPRNRRAGSCVPDTAACSTAGALIHFADEAGICSDYHADTTWVPLAETPVVCNTGARFSIDMISAVTDTGALRFGVYEGTATAETFIDFGQRLLHDAPGRVYLIVNGPFRAPGHAHHRVRRLHRRSPQACSSSLGTHPNSDEWVWKIAKTGVTTKGDLKTKALGALRRLLGALRRLQKLSALVRGFFADPHLRYITT
jgi:hypothetical protein